MQNCNSKFKTDLKQKTFDFSLAIITLTNELPNKRSAWVIADQLIRSATSIGANIVEARASSSRLEFKRYFEISLKSSNESKYWLELLGEAGLSDKNKINKLLIELKEISNILAKSVLSLRKKSF